MVSAISSSPGASNTPAPAPPRQTDSFQQQLLTFLTDAMEKLGLDPAGLEISEAPLSGQKAANSNTARQFLVTYNPAQAGEQTPNSPPADWLGPFYAAARAPRVATAAQASAAPVEEVDANATPVEVLSERLRATGIDPAALNLTESREIVTYPGGSYENHLIKADFGDGITERYSVDLMLRNPQVTVVEIQRLMNQSVMSV